jgi:formate--tetrahydrofolate ligase
LGENHPVTFPSDLEIAQAARMLPITEIAGGLGLSADHVETHGRHVAKIELEAIADAAAAGRQRAKYVVVTAVTPTPLGEGKTTTSVGLAQAMARIGRKGLLASRAARQAAGTARWSRWSC